MSWRVVFAPAVEQDIAEAADWYESRQPGLGAQFVEETIRVWDALAENPLLNCRRHPIKNIRWRYPERFPYRVIYEVNEEPQTKAPPGRVSRRDERLSHNRKRCS